MGLMLTRQTLPPREAYSLTLAPFVEFTAQLAPLTPVEEFTFSEPSGRKQRPAELAATSTSALFSVKPPTEMISGLSLSLPASGKAALAQLLPLESPAKEAEGLMLEVNVKSTSRLRRDASNCAVCTAAASCAALLLARFSAIKVEKDGMATAANTAITATVTISSINVNPRALTCGRSRITAGIADPF
nr:hypothetical protein [Comamonas fluminis]